MLLCCHSTFAICQQNHVTCLGSDVGFVGAVSGFGAGSGGLVSSIGVCSWGSSIRTGTLFAYFHSSNESKPSSPVKQKPYKPQNSMTYQVPELEIVQHLNVSSLS